ncbi:hypothetical protein VP1G_02184 [Cytospora mali]|uniref:Uncharacterized protein n=1 Tax=Cytospora mali TaxID=578113 RepID=A0A194UT34_CYTMA|nr:hypothetical protein VP1G_02184 [Valsa mali var. pyri (nom. inval.)]
MPNQLQPTAHSSLSPHWEAIDESLLKFMYDADQAIYPAPSLTYDRLKSWAESCPELCIVLRRGHDDSQPQVSSASAVSESVLGSIIVLPLLRRYWVQLTAEGRSEGPLLLEHHVDPMEMFPPRTGALGSEKAEVGLHVFHIERFRAFTTGGEGKRIGFTQLALEEIRGRVEVKFPSLHVIGYSALTVTPEGNRAFKRSGFSPTYTSRPRFSGPAKYKSPNDLAWEALTSSSPVPTQYDGIPTAEPQVAEHADELLDTGEALTNGLDQQDNFDPIVEVQVPQEDAIEHEAAEGDVHENQALDIEAPEDSGGEDGSSEPSQDAEGDTTALTSSSEGHRSSFFTTPGSQKPKIRAPYLIFDKSPPRGFKVLKKPKASTEHRVRAKKERMGDGFSDREARPSPLGRRRRLHHLEPDVGSLELTQKVSVSQQTQKSTRGKLDDKRRSYNNVGLWHRRQYFGTSQFGIEPQDPVDSFEVRQDGTEDEVSAPTTMSVHSGQGSADYDIDLIVIPQTDPPEPSETEENGLAAGEWTELTADRANNHLPPKRFLNARFEELDSLTLRPDSMSWLRAVTRTSETPPPNDAVRHHPQ